MKPEISDFVIHVSDTLPEQDMTGLTDWVCRDACVTSACVSQNDPHLIIVNYDSNCASASDIVHKLTSRGIRARAVGM
jgi:hypothetical protein